MMELKCGCKIDGWIYTPMGCCCGECYSYDEAELRDAEITEPCEVHGG